MQDVVEHGCLTQRSQLERLQDLADSVTRARVKTLAANEYLPTFLFVIDREGKDSVYELDRMELARYPMGARLSQAQVSLDNLVPTHAIIRIARDAQASASAVITAANVSMAALQLADLDHEYTLTSRIDRSSEATPTLGKWDFGSVVWAVRLRQVLQAATPASGEDFKQEPLGRPITAPQGLRPSDPTPSRRNHRREMREQLHGTPAAAPSWLQ